MSSEVGSTVAASEATALMEKPRLVQGGIAKIDIEMLEGHITREVETYSMGGFPRQSERYYRLMSVLHVTRMMYHDGYCLPIHREFYKRLAQIHHNQQQQKLQLPQSALELSAKSSSSPGSAPDAETELDADSSSKVKMPKLSEEDAAKPVVAASNPEAVVAVASSDVAASLE
ncbi:hypothetical protein GGI04_002220 [Coemansia thaxteri]|uniref:Uncharacterized protein n=1 Tax=Coemansia thaxteri TaxID=2663907 RepID=A0A9W8BJX8_9FUNG|nr:hypothetical protein H4R26_002480 [Coemansia thaxteri]KAJ2005515.1 hypothetical protein GGI04_002220 [Coemansia thaxteri]KAJ2470514.1 hypothetical protein GGI02_002874 [Coemansia sp. RSA 2322]KAJ2484346.1 hypothetical protein EV174_002505 [Coemansia sp. RSA 2320]